MAKVEEGKFVAYSYKLYNDANGDLLFETPADHPDVMVYGLSHDVVPGLVAAMRGLSAGDKFSVTLPAEVAFGERFDDNVIKLDKELFMRDGQLADAVKVGAMLPMMTEEGFQVQGKVLSIGEKDVEMDFNHPFAGLTVKFDGEIKEVRDATPEEIAALQSHGCGCGCHHDSCGEGCEGGCEGGHCC
ncbi:MAG: FKBP-type peptidyl-prolyl cis-trans isomerase [Muribaculaceae bacterium]|nr:FKBP-type peptidyl-prolyl cis-trans isomerase [Muribaculaceae bacterium]